MEPKIGDIFYTLNWEEYEILSIDQTTGYVSCQLSAMKRAGLSYGKELIHKSELSHDGKSWRYL